MRELPSRNSEQALLVAVICCFILVSASCTQGNLKADKTIRSADSGKKSFTGESPDTKIDTTIHIITSNDNYSFTLEELKKVLKPAILTTDDIVYKKTKTYEGFWLTDLLEYTKAIGDRASYAIFRSLDGYEVRLSISELMEAQPRGLIAFRDVNSEDHWEKIQQGNKAVSPAPYYLVWGITNKGEKSGTKESLKKRPWPYQLIWIEVKNAD